MTTEIVPNCAKCGQAMQCGFILDIGYGKVTQSVWVEGVPERSRWAGVKLEGREQLAITTFRCPECGYLESYSRPA